MKANILSQQQHALGPVRTSLAVLASAELVSVLVAIMSFSAAAQATATTDPDSQDIWTTSVYSYAPGASFPGGGLADDLLRVGGYGDLYYSLLKFDTSQSPANATSATIQLYDASANGGTPTGLNLYQINSPWDWTTTGTGRDNNRLWWADRPSVSLLSSNLPAPTVGSYYSIDVTSLYNAWKSGAVANEGVELQPLLNNNNFDQFASSRNPTPGVAPVLIVNSGSLTPPSLALSQFHAFQSIFPSIPNTVLSGNDPAYGMTFDAWMARLHQAAEQRNASGVKITWQDIPQLLPLVFCAIEIHDLDPSALTDCDTPPFTSFMTVLMLN